MGKVLLEAWQLPLSDGFPFIIPQQRGDLSPCKGAESRERMALALAGIFRGTMVAYVHRPIGDRGPLTSLLFPVEGAQIREAAFW